MHPKNIFQFKPLALVLGSLLLIVAPIQLLLALATERENSALVERGIERMASVVALSGGARIAAQSAKKGASHCRWEVEANGQRCVEIFPLPCPKEISETPMIFLEDDPSTCRVLSRAAVDAEEMGKGRISLALALLGAGLGLLALGRSSFFASAPQASLKDHQ